MQFPQNWGERYDPTPIWSTCGCRHRILAISNDEIKQ